MQTRRAVLGLLAAAPAIAARPRPPASTDLVAAARRQIGVTTHYDPGYHRIGYPWGDLPRDTGVCADVVIRAVRDAWRVDLQQLVHEDMARDFAAYPHRWGLAGPDSNIDHRRVPNLETYWTRHGGRVWQAKGATWGGGFPGPLLPGDLLTWRSFTGGGPHVAIVSAGGFWPRIIQNFGWGTREDTMITQWLAGANGHYRWTPHV